MHTKRILVVGALALAALSGCSQQKPPEYADVKAMMNLHVQPKAQDYWDAVRYISDERGTREIVPQNDAEWKRTADAARDLKALGESLKQPAYAQGKGSDWLDFAQGLATAAGQAETAARSHQPDKVIEAGGTLYNVCSACHETYMPSPARPAPTGQAGAKPVG